MPEKYHIKTQPVPPRWPRIGKYGVVDWREDCARCHNCVKKACVYDRYRQEADYIRNLKDVDALFFDCMGCFSCVQECTKGLLCMSINPVYAKMGNKYLTPDIIKTTWLQAETAKIPVSGAGYRGPFSGHGFDSMWTDMSEIVRPTRDGIHGREYISTSVDIGRKPAYLTFDGENFNHEAHEEHEEKANNNNSVKVTTKMPPLVSLPMPLIIDMCSPSHTLPQLDAIIRQTAVNTDLIAIVDSRQDRRQRAEDRGQKTEGQSKETAWATSCPSYYNDEQLKHIAFYFGTGEVNVPAETLRKTRLVEIADSGNVTERIKAIKKIHPEIVIAVRVELTAGGVERAIELAGLEDVEVIHVVADANGNEIEEQNRGSSLVTCDSVQPRPSCYSPLADASQAVPPGSDMGKMPMPQPRFVKDMIRQIHTALIEKGNRDEITLMVGGGIALPEHMAKVIICGADLVTINLPLLIALECRLCAGCRPGMKCPAGLDKIDYEYGVGRMTNLIAAWHDQLIELMGAMGMREARRLRGDVGRAMFFETLEEETFGKLFGARKI